MKLLVLLLEDILVVFDLLKLIVGGFDGRCLMADDILRRADQSPHLLGRNTAGWVSSEDSRRYEVRGQTKRWHEFDSNNICSNPKMRIALDIQFAPQWQAWLPHLVRVIQNERQLEHLYHSTLITRVNIALQRALSSDSQCVTIVVSSRGKYRWMVLASLLA